MGQAAFLRRTMILCASVLGIGLQGAAVAQSSPVVSCQQQFEAAGLKRYDGLFQAYGKPGGEIYIGIRTEDLDQDFIFANYVDRGVSEIVGRYADPKLVRFRRSGDVIDILQADSRMYFDDAAPLRRAQKLTMSDTILASLKILKCAAPERHYVQIDQTALSGLSGEFYASLERKIGGNDLKWEKSSLVGWEVFSDNLSFVSDHKVGKEVRPRDPANGWVFSVRVRHLLLKRSSSGYAPRRADPRVGYFTVYRKNFGAIDQTEIATFIHRWRLEKKKPQAALSEPVKPIVFWIENTTPTELRPHIRRGVLAWNEAFEKAGFSNAVEVRDQPDDAPWEAGDISKNVIRWQAAAQFDSSLGFGPAVYDPVTGEILGADILMTFASIGDYIDDWDRLPAGAALDAAEIAVARSAAADGDRLKSTHGENALFSQSQVLSGADGLARLSVLANLVEKARGPQTGGRVGAEKIRSHNAPADDARGATLVNDDETGGAPGIADPGLADRLIEEVIVNLIMHEVGHTLGLTHNFRGSYWRSIDEIFDSKKTNGLISASVMDYTPLNLSPIGVEQGDFANTRVGPYDMWAIEFGYRPPLADAAEEEARRNALLRKAGQPGLLYGAPEVRGDDPWTLEEDLTNDPVAYAEARLSLVLAMAERAGEGAGLKSLLEYHSLYNELFGQIFSAANAIGSQIKPYVFGPFDLNGAEADAAHIFRINDEKRQKSAMSALGRLIFAPGAVEMSDDFLFRLGANGNVVDQVAGMRIGVKSFVFHRLIDRDLLLQMHHAAAYGGDYGATDMLLDLKNAVFGRDLNILARPGKDRRDQQILFARALVSVIEDAESDERRRNSLIYRTEQSIISASVRPVLNALSRELFFENPWAPPEINAHRQELHEILSAVR